jgi:hypothetical protein
LFFVDLFQQNAQLSDCFLILCPRCFIDPNQRRKINAFEANAESFYLEGMRQDADAMTDTPANVSDDLYTRLRKQFSEEQLMQLGAQIAFENYRARWNRIFNVESDHLYTPQRNNSQQSHSA